MVLVESAIIAAAAFAIAASAQHLWDRYSSNGLYRRVEARAEAALAQSSPRALGEALRPLQEVVLKLNANLESAQIQAEKALESVEGMPSPEMQAVQAAGADSSHLKALERKAMQMIGKDALGPYGSVLNSLAPNVYAFLTENPEMVQVVLSWPWVQSLLKKAESMVGSQGGTPGWGP